MKATNTTPVSLDTTLLNIERDLKGQFNIYEFTPYLIVFIAFKKLSSIIEEMAKKEFSIEKYFSVTDNEIIEKIQKKANEEIGYFFHPTHTFSYITKREETQDPIAILENFLNILCSLNISIFEKLNIQDKRLGNTLIDRERTITKIFFHIEKINENLDMGDFYEYIIRKYKVSSSKARGEFYTPKEIGYVMGKLLHRDEKATLSSVYDPTCGSCSLLVNIFKKAKKNRNFYGQEINKTTHSLGYLNLLLLGIPPKNIDIQLGNTLENPYHIDKKFDLIVANPPFSQQWSANENTLFNNDKRFSTCGGIAPSKTADFAFLQHIIYHMKDNGTAFCILPLGVLFRLRKELSIRKYIIENLNIFDAVIGLPAKLFSNTSLCVCMVVIKKNRENKKDILFIDASKEYGEKTETFFLREKDIEKITTTYLERKTIDKYSYVAPLQEIRENEYNLNIPRYVDTFEKEKDINLEEVAEDMRKTSEEIKKVNKEITEFCNELGIKTPFETK